MNGIYTTVAGTGFIVLPVIRRIATTEQVKKMPVVDFIFSDVLHVSNLFSQIRLNG